MTLNIILKNGISADGFDTVIENGDETIHKESWSYGYNCSYNKAFANSRKPYVTDVLQNLIDQYNVDDVSIRSGMNLFANHAMSSEKANEFEAKYCSNLKLSAQKEYEQQPKTDSLTLTDADLSFVEDPSVSL